MTWWAAGLSVLVCHLKNVWSNLQAQGRCYGKQVAAENGNHFTSFPAYFTTTSRIDFTLCCESMLSAIDHQLGSGWDPRLGNARQWGMN